MYSIIARLSSLQRSTLLLYHILQLLCVFCFCSKYKRRMKRNKSFVLLSERIKGEKKTKRVEREKTKDNRWKNFLLTSYTVYYMCTFDEGKK